MTPDSGRSRCGAEKCPHCAKSRLVRCSSIRALVAGMHLTVPRPPCKLPMEKMARKFSCVHAWRSQRQSVRRTRRVHHSSKVNAFAPYGDRDVADQAIVSPAKSQQIDLPATALADRRPAPSDVPCKLPKSSSLSGANPQCKEARQQRRPLLLCAQFIDETRRSPRKFGHFVTETRLAWVSRRTYLPNGRTT